MDTDDAITAGGQIVSRCRWGALATLSGDGLPLASQVAVAVDADASMLVMHLSQLAEHTRNLICRPAASLVLGEVDHGGPDPQTLARITFTGAAVPVSPGAPDYESARAAYLARLPASAARFGFGDFSLYGLRPGRAQYVGGFARAFGFDATQVVQVLAAAGARA